MALTADAPPTHPGPVFARGRGPPGLPRWASRAAETLAALLEFGSVVLAGYVAIRSLVYGTWFFSPEGPHGILAATMISLFLTYVLVSRCLKLQGAGSIERIAISAAVTLSAIELYELFWNGGWLTTNSFLWIANSEPFLGELAQGSVILSAAGFLILFSLMFTGIRYMRLNRVFYADLGLSLIVFSVWIAVGFPQFYGNSCPNYQNCNPPYAVEAQVFNAATKFLVDFIPATLFLPVRLRALAHDFAEDLRHLRTGLSRRA